MTRKISATYLVLTLVLLSITGLAFSGLVQRHLVQTTLDRMADETEILLNTFGQQGVPRGERLRTATLARILGSAISSGVVVTDPGFRVINSTDLELFPPHNPLMKQLQMLAGDSGVVRLNSGRYIVRSSPLAGGAGWLFLIADFGQIRTIQAGILRMLGLSAIVATIAVVAAGSLLSNLILAPLGRLVDQVGRLARREFYRVEISTGDELEHLADAINELAGSLEFFEQNQRELFQNISHELKTPLMSIQGYAEGIADGVFDRAETERALAVIAREAQAMKSMVDQLIFLSRMEDPAEPYCLAPVPLSDILSEAVEAVRGLAADRNVALTIAHSEETVQADAGRMVRALVNILANAIRYATDTVSVTVSRDRSGVVIRVHDDGPGFDASDLQRLGTRFYRGEGGQTGLGLAIARAIVDRHGGRMELANAAVGGAEVRILLPAP